MTHSGCISNSQMHNISEQMCKSQIEMNGNYDTKPKKIKMSLIARAKYV